MYDKIYLNPKIEFEATKILVHISQKIDIRIETTNAEE